MSLIVKISADTSAFKRAINTISRDVQGMGTTISKIGDSFTPISVGAAGLFAAAIKSGAEFEAKMSQVSAVGQVYGKELDALTEKAKEIGLQTKFSASEAADGLLYMGQAGWSAQESLEGIDAVMTLAAAGALDVGRASDIVTDAITAMGYSAKDSAKFVDILAVTASSSNTTVDKMGDSFKFASQIAGTLGINLEDLSLALGLMANASVKGQNAGTSLRAGLVNLAKPTKQMKDAMEKYNVALVTNADGSVNLRATMQQLRTSMAGLDETQQAAALSAIFGKTALSGWAAIVNASDDDFNRLAGAIDNSTGKAKEMQDTMMNNTEGSVKKMMSAIEGALIAVFEAISPVVTDVANVITELANKFASLDKDTQAFIITGLAIGGLVAPVMKVVGAVVKLGAKIGAIPVALSKMKNGEVERQVNAWLKWHKVTDEQAAHLRKVARDLDTVKRGGAGAENAAQRLANEFKRVGVPVDVAPDLGKVERAAEQTSREVKNLSRDLGGLKVKGVRGIKVDGKSVEVDAKSIQQKFRNSGATKGIGKDLGTSAGKETAEYLGSALGSELGSTIGSKMGPIGALIGDIIGESAGEGLAKVVTSGSAFSKVLSTIPKLFNPVTLGVTVFAGGLLGLTKHLSTTSNEFNLFGTSVDESGKEFEGFKGASEEANEMLKEFSKTWSTFDPEGTVKKFEIQVDVDYEANTKQKLADMEKTLEDHFKHEIELVKNNNALTEEEKERVIKALSEKQTKLEKVLTDSFGRQEQAEKDWNTKMGKERYDAGKTMVFEELKRQEEIEKALATTQEQKLEIERKYNGLRKEAMADYVKENFDTIKGGFQDEIKAHATHGEDQLAQLRIAHEEKMKLIKEQYGEGTEEYKIAMAAEISEYSRKKQAIIDGTNEEIKKSGERIEAIKQEIYKMKENGDISVEECENMLKALGLVADVEFDPKEVKVTEDGVVEAEESLKEIDKYDGKVTQTTLSINKVPYDEGVKEAELAKQRLEGNPITVPAGMDKSPWGTDLQGLKTDVEEANKWEIKPQVRIEKGSDYAMTVESIKQEMEGLTANERLIYLNTNYDRFKTNMGVVREALDQIEKEEKEAPLGLDDTSFQQGKTKVQEQLEELGYKVYKPKIGADIIQFKGETYTVEEALKKLEDTEVAAIISANPELFYGHEKEVKERLEQLEVTEAVPDVGLETIEFDGKLYTVNSLIDDLGVENPIPKVGLDTSEYDTKDEQTHAKIDDLGAENPIPIVGLDTKEYDEKDTKTHAKIDDLGAENPIPTLGFNTREYDSKDSQTHDKIDNLDSQTPTPKADMDTKAYMKQKGIIDTYNRDMSNTTNSIKTSLDRSGFDTKRSSFSTWLFNNPLTQIVNTIFKTGDRGRSSVYGRAIDMEETIVGRSIPQTVPRRNSIGNIATTNGNNSYVNGQNSNEVGSSSDTYNVTIVGANKSAKELFDEIEQYKNTVSRYKGTRRF